MSYTNDYPAAFLCFAIISFALAFPSKSCVSFLQSKETLQLLFPSEQHPSQFYHIVIRTSSLELHMTSVTGRD